MNFHKDFSRKKGRRKRKLIGSIVVMFFMKTGVIFFLTGESPLFFSKDVALVVESYGASVYINKSKLRIPMAKLPKKHLKVPWIKEHKIKNYYALFKKQQSVIDVSFPDLQDYSYFQTLASFKKEGLRDQHYYKK